MAQVRYTEELLLHILYKNRITEDTHIKIGKEFFFWQKTEERKVFIMRNGGGISEKERLADHGEEFSLQER